MLPTRHHFCPSTSSPPSYPPPSEPLAAAAALSESLVIAIMRVCSYLRGFYNLLSSVSAPYLCRCCVHQTCQSLVFYPHFNGFFHCCWMNCWIQPLSDVFVPESRASVTTAPHVLLKCDSSRPSEELILAAGVYDLIRSEMSWRRILSISVRFRSS